MHQTNAVSLASPNDDQSRSRAGGKTLIPSQSVLRRPDVTRRSDRLHRRVTFNVSIDQEIKKIPLRHYWRDGEIKRVLECVKRDYPGTWNIRKEKEKQWISYAIASDLFDNGYHLHPKTVHKKITFLWKRYSECLETGDDSYKFYTYCHDAFTRSEQVDNNDNNDNMILIL
ncbi:hypothetical protein BDA99DRAFT_601161 [Phascolomyces articulosus]|uniref:Uncharacterized protein n=1 Tax=Phascolomyces articulosus TaxID=60185 RepID=A0AAD5PIX2_9FUNG|nr:hypothetical protein BDA99DRAFT_601161 [Phascolomyces articulosus]